MDDSEPPDLHAELTVLTHERDQLQREVAHLKSKIATLFRPQPIDRYEAYAMDAEGYDVPRSEHISIDLPLTVPTAVRLINAIAAYFPGALIAANHDPQKIVVVFDQARLDELKREANTEA